MPGMRAAVSDTAISGSLPMSSATIASTTWGLLRLMLRADCSERRKPVTTIAVLSAGVSCAAGAASAGGGGVACAIAGEAATHSGAKDEPDRRMDEKRRKCEPPLATISTLKGLRPKYYPKS